MDGYKKQFLSLSLVLSVFQSLSIFISVFKAAVQPHNQYMRLSDFVGNVRIWDIFVTIIYTLNKMKYHHCTE